MSEPDNLILVHLRELRAELSAVEGRMAERFEAIERRLGKMQANGVKALQSFIGHRTMVERTMASFDDEIVRLKQRIDTLELPRP